MVRGHPHMDGTGIRARPLLVCLIASALASLILVHGVGAAEPIYGGPGSPGGSFEGGPQQNCDGEDRATDSFAVSVQDCDFTGDPDPPDGTQVMREMPSGLDGGHGWNHVFSRSASEIWVDLWIKVIADAVSFNNLFCLTDTSGHNLFYCLNMNVGDATTRIVAGGANCEFPETRTTSQWCTYRMRADTETGEVDLWCDCDGSAAGCGDDLSAEIPDATCRGNPSFGSEFEGFVLYGTGHPVAEWRMDDIRVYDADPAPEPSPGLLGITSIGVLHLLRRRSVGRSHRRRARDELA